MSARRLKPGRRRRDADATAVAAGGSWGYPAAVVGLCLLHFALAVTSVRHKSATYDELAHLTRGYSYFLTGDYRLGPPHPPLAHYWAALPGLGHTVKFPPLLMPEPSRIDWRQSDMWEVGRQFFYYKNTGNAAVIDALLWRGRAMIALWSVGLGLLTFWWARRLFGRGPGLLALALYAFSPTMLAHARLVTTDLAAAAFFMCSLTTIWWSLHHVRGLSVAASAASLAALFLAKLSAVLIIPAGLVMLGLRLVRGGALPVSFGRRRREIRTRIGQVGCFSFMFVVWVAVVYASIWGAYGFRYAAMVDADPKREHLYTNSPVPPGKSLWEHVLRSKTPKPGEPLERGEISDDFRSAIYWLRDHRVFPEAYIYSAAYARQTARGRNAFLDGELRLRGFASFFPKAFLYKTPLPLLVLLVVGAAASVLRRRFAGPSAEPHEVRAAEAGWSWAAGEPARTGWASLLYASAPLWVFFAIYWYSSLRATLNIGHRHILPTYPMLFVLAGAAGLLWRSRRRAVRAAPVGLAALFAAASLSIFPNYLTYFNWLAGGPANGYRHLVDSSLDWGQDLPDLGAYLAERRGGGLDQPVWISYFGSAGTPGMEHFGIEATPVPTGWPRDARGDQRLQPGLYAISATNLQQVYASISEDGAQFMLNPWTPKLEEIYRERLPVFEACMAAPDDADARRPWTSPAMQRDLREFAALRFARLCAYLRSRTPDHVVNHTIMIYELDAPELDAALSGPV